MAVLVWCFFKNMMMVVAVVMVTMMNCALSMYTTA